LIAFDEILSKVGNLTDKWGSHRKFGRNSSLGIAVFARRFPISSVSKICECKETNWSMPMPFMRRLIWQSKMSRFASNSGHWKFNSDPRAKHFSARNSSSRLYRCSSKILPKCRQLISRISMRTLLIFTSDCFQREVNRLHQQIKSQIIFQNYRPNCSFLTDVGTILRRKFFISILFTPPTSASQYPSLFPTSILSHCISKKNVMEIYPNFLW
jgi:hypothetical protein